MGNGIPAAPVASKTDHDIARRVIAGDRCSAYTRDELVEIVRKDALYQRLCRLKHELETEPNPTNAEIWRARLEVRRAFRRFQLLRIRNRMKWKEVEVVKGRMYQRMKQAALEKSSMSIQKIQQVLGIEHLKVDEVTPEFQDRLFARPASRVTEIARTLREPLVAPTLTSPEESPPTPS